jgi:hypothetical protein
LATASCVLMYVIALRVWNDSCEFNTARARAPAAWVPGWREWVRRASGGAAQHTRVTVARACSTEWHAHTITRHTSTHLRQVCLDLHVELLALVHDGLDLCDGV